jgi:hypothetical protein
VLRKRLISVTPTLSQHRERGAALVAVMWNIANGGVRNGIVLVD